MPSKHMTQHKSYKSQLRTSEVPLIQFGGKKWGDELLVTKHGHWKMIFRWRFLVILEDFLVGGLEHFFPYIGNTVIIPTDFYIFQTGRYTTNQVALDNLRGIEEMHPCSVHLSDLPMRVVQNFFQPMKGYGHTQEVEIGHANVSLLVYELVFDARERCNFFYLPCFVDFV